LYHTCTAPKSMTYTKAWSGSVQGNPTYENNEIDEVSVDPAPPKNSTPTQIAFVLIAVDSNTRIG